MKRQGIIFIISAPSGAGKSTLCARLVRTIPNIVNSISCTTRPKRSKEQDGKDYYFLTEEEFKEKIEKKEFIEWAKVHGFYYGTPKDFLEKTIRKGKDIILNIDVQGALKVRKIYPMSVLIFIMPPSFKELEIRLRKRKMDSLFDIEKRLKNAKEELKFLPKYDYLVVNNKIQEALKDLNSIIRAEHIRLARLPISEIMKYSS